MKLSLFLTCCASLPVCATDFNAPNHQVAVHSNDAVSVDAAGQTVLVLDPDTTGMKAIEVSWNPDSTRVIAVETYGKGSVVLGAWKDAKGWHKTLQDDKGFARVLGLAFPNFTLKNECRAVSAWESDDTVRLTGVLDLADGTELHYVYRLKFTPGTGSSSRGGYVKGALQAVGFRFENSI